MKTLAHFRFTNYALRCHRCEWLLPGNARAEQHGNYVVIECPKCKLVTPFKMEKAS